MWYSVSILMKATSPSKEPLPAPFEESILLILAEDGQSAKVDAERIAKKEESDYRSASGEQITWRFNKVLALYEIGQDFPVSGTEIFSRFLQTSEATSLQQPL
jgi:hypothetical protein